MTRNLATEPFAGMFERSFRHLVREGATLEDQLDDLDSSASDDPEMGGVEGALDAEGADVGRESAEAAARLDGVARAKRDLVASVEGEIAEFDAALGRFADTVDAFNAFLTDAGNDKSVKYLLTQSPLLKGGAAPHASKEAERLLDQSAKAARECAVLSQAMRTLAGSLDAAKVVEAKLAAAALASE